MNTARRKLLLLLLLPWSLGCAFRFGLTLLRLNLRRLDRARLCLSPGLRVCLHTWRRGKLLPVSHQGRRHVLWDEHHLAGLTRRTDISRTRNQLHWLHGDLPVGTLDLNIILSLRLKVIRRTGSG